MVNNALGYTMESLRESVDDSAVDVDFGVDNVSSRYASGMRMRSASPAVSEASSCTLGGDDPEVESNSNGESTSSTALHTLAYPSSLSGSPATPATPAQKRCREDDISSELSLTDRETFNKETSNKRRTGASLAAFRSTNANCSVTRPQTIPQSATLNNDPLNSLRAHQSTPWGNSPTLPIRLSTPHPTINPLRETSLPVRPKETIDVDNEEDSPVFKLPDGAVLIDLEDYEGEARLEEEIFGIGPQIASQSSLQRAPLAKRNPEILPPNVEVESTTWNSSLLRPGKTVELVNGTFLKIKAIVKNLTSDDVSVRGWKLVRVREFVLGGMVQKKRNELAFIHEIDRDDGRDVWEQSVDTARLEDVVRIRRLICTNRPFPECRYSKEDIPSEFSSKGEKDQMKYITDEMVLVVRWAFIARYADAEARVRKGPLVDRPKESVILRSLKKEECTKGEFVEPNIQKLLWRGETVLGGSGGDPSNNRSKYTYGDGYCGAGGMTVGAAAAGLNVKWGFDFNSHAGLTWQKNFPLAQFHLLPVNEFVDLPDPHRDLWVDILHLSPPCQVFSPIHTVPGQHDEMNYASLFGVGVAIKKARPRIVTLEQTFGILHPKNKNAFNGLISCFTDLGFDVSWQVVKFQGYGSPSRRTRLIILAACPGEDLPHMPHYTHTDPLLSRAPHGQTPYRTPNQALSAIPRHAPNHNPQQRLLHRAAHVPWDGSVICGCIMTGGGIGLGLPNGSRGMTNRELAALQTFPLTHVFHGQEIRKQVGNAVPPAFGKVLLGSVRRQLERRDGWVRGRGFVIRLDEE
ncbi:hypothetical protein DSL72_000271 [Monilinia vaccinii-corymbosi]|uniref:DNA (cytosine-5-)-methyltransferase n=1 Tax=Monilinia vaccinii-corymbosi TaxID=61207 RepID=A0A8A3NYU6_9HELO|nr:hypothetical protein DSL72_000271 [Monilinia vaccinii-corymbosi]